MDQSSPEIDWHVLARTHSDAVSKHFTRIMIEWERFLCDVAAETSELKTMRMGSLVIVQEQSIQKCTTYTATFSGFFSIMKSLPSCLPCVIIIIKEHTHITISTLRAHDAHVGHTRNVRVHVATGMIPSEIFFWKHGSSEFFKFYEITLYLFTHTAHWVYSSSVIFCSCVHRRRRVSLFRLNQNERSSLVESFLCTIINELSIQSQWN